jgi:hypothetical protein
LHPAARLVTVKFDRVTTTAIRFGLFNDPPGVFVVKPGVSVAKAGVLNIKTGGRSIMSGGEFAKA